MDSGSPAPDLRAADWRFLLAPRGEIRRIGIDGGPLELADSLASSGWEVQTRHLASPGGPASDPYDAIALLAGATLSPEAVRGSLRPGGALFWVVPRARVGRLSLPQLRQVGPHGRLRRAGFEELRPWWLTPGVGGVAMFLPLERDALAWYLDARFRPVGLGRRLAAAGLRALGPWGPRLLAALVPTIAWTGVMPVPPTETGRTIAAPSPAAEPVPAVLRGMSLAADMSGQAPIVLAGGEAWNGCALLLRGADGQTLNAVARIGRTPPLGARMRAASEIVGRIREDLPASLQATLPKPLALGSWRGLPVVAETALPGRSLHRRLAEPAAGRSGRREDLLAAASWLAAFHAASRPPAGPRPEEELEAWLTTIEASGRLVPGLYPLVAWLRTEIRIAEDRTGSLPAVWEHGDFGPWNILRSRHRLGVLDWEDVRAGLPLRDLYGLLLAWGWLQSGRGRSRRQPGEVMAALLIDEGTGPAAADARAAQARYLASFPVPEAWRLPLLGLTVVGGLARRVVRARELDAPQRVDPVAEAYGSCVSALSTRLAARRR